jgi:hypothetical protein
MRLNAILCAADDGNDLLGVECHDRFARVIQRLFGPRASSLSVR